jgi:hypothetical protein
MSMFPRRLLPFILIALAIPGFCVILIFARQGGASWPALAAIAGGLLLAPLLVMRPFLWLAGWDALARAFPASPQHLRTATWHDHVTSVALRQPWMSLNNCVIWSATDQHLLLAIAQPLRCGAPAICLPWRSLATCTAHAPNCWEIIMQATSPLPLRLYVEKALITPATAVAASQSRTGQVAH